MARGEVFPIINCKDLLATKAFYRTVFDGRQSYEYVHEGQEVYVTLDVGAGKIALGHGTGPAMYGETPRPATGHAVDLCVYVPDLDAAVAAAPAAGGRIAVEPQQMPWGERVAYLEDPEGTMVLAIQEPLSA
jgi:predicted enzyme related to lactoylglutathione lyase